ncbi:MULTISPECIES: hypothetical protein [Bacillus]
MYAKCERHIVRLSIPLGYDIKFRPIRNVKV